MRVIQWDAFGFQDPVSQRLADMSPSICSTIDIRRPDGWDGLRRFSVRRGEEVVGTRDISAMDAVLSLCRGEFTNVMIKFNQFFETEGTAFIAR